SVYTVCLPSFLTYTVFLLPSSLHLLFSFFPTRRSSDLNRGTVSRQRCLYRRRQWNVRNDPHAPGAALPGARLCDRSCESGFRRTDRKSTRLNSSHEWNSYAVFCLKKKKTEKKRG